MNISLTHQELFDLRICYKVYIELEQKRPYTHINDIAAKVVVQANTLELLLSIPEIPLHEMGTVTCTPAEWRDMLKVLTAEHFFSPYYAERHQHLHRMLTEYTLVAAVEESLSDTQGLFS